MLTEDDLRQLFPKAADNHIATFLGQGEELFDQYGLTENPVRLHFFLAQIGHESGGLTVTEERLSYSAKRLVAVWPSRFENESAAAPFARNPENLANNVYSSRMGNGPPASGDGWRYRGRGYVQVTGRDGYKKVGAVAGLDLEQQPDLAFNPATSLRVACAFWQWKRLNAICDTGDYVKVTRRINGGTNGLADRRAWLDKVLRILGKAPGEPTALNTAEIIDVQRALQSAGFTQIGAADGIIGPRSIAAITLYRQKFGLGEGLIDDVLLESLKVAA